jgi:hypothetical protein
VKIWQKLYPRKREKNFQKLKQSKLPQQKKAEFLLKVIVQSTGR